METSDSETTEPDGLPRFWNKVNKTDGCWLWTASRKQSGYGQFKLGRSVKRAHRVSFELAHGPIPNGMDVDHTCHTRACVNPAHLRLVTHAANSQNRAGADRDSKSGIRGVYHLPSGRWQASARLHGKQRNLGYFSTAEEAEAVVIAWRRTYMTYSVVDHGNERGIQ